MKAIDFNQAVRNAVADEAALRRALAQSDIAPLLMVLVHHVFVLMLAVMYL